MRPGNHPGRGRLRVALVVVGGTVGILALFFLQFAIPYVLGPIGLVLVTVLDLSIYLGFRHRRMLRKQRPRYPRVSWGPVDRRYAARRADALEKEIVATFVFVAFLVVIYIAGLAIRIEFWWVAPNVNLYILGSIMTSIALRFSMGYRYDYLESEAEKFDTTEDH